MYMDDHECILVIFQEVLSYSRSHWIQGEPDIFRGPSGSCCVFSAGRLVPRKQRALPDSWALLDGYFRIKAEKLLSFRHLFQTAALGWGSNKSLQRQNATQLFALGSWVWCFGSNMPAWKLNPKASDVES